MDQCGTSANMQGQVGLPETSRTHGGNGGSIRASGLGGSGPASGLTPLQREGWTGGDSQGRLVIIGIMQETHCNRNWEAPQDPEESGAVSAAWTGLVTAHVAPLKAPSKPGLHE